MNWFISLASLVLMFLVQPETDIYAQAMAVVEVTDEWVICVDFNGNEWSFENSSKDWYVGDIASTIYNRKTICTNTRNTRGTIKTTLYTNY